MLAVPKTNLNTISFEAVYTMIRRAQAAGISIQAGFVDTLGKAETYEKELSRRFPSIRWTVRSKADSLFPPTGAASIVAKVIRDDVLSTCWSHLDLKTSDRETVSFARDKTPQSSEASSIPSPKNPIALLSNISGYPGDAQTIQWLRSQVDPVFGFPDVVRFSWGTCTSLLTSQCLPIRWEDEEISNSVELSKRSQSTLKPADQYKRKRKRSVEINVQKPDVPSYARGMIPSSLVNSL